MSMSRNEPLDLSRARVLLLAGGASSRFYPLDNIFSDPTGSGRTLLRQTFDRVASRIDDERRPELLSPGQCFVVTGPASRDRVIAELDLPRENVIVEPCRRSTWPAILWALARLRSETPDPVIAVLPADHWIGDTSAFRESLVDAFALALSRPAIVTFGIEPKGGPERWVSFGTIRAREDASAEETHARLIERFEEKPDLDRASEMIREGGWWWNSGMFVFRLETAERALETLSPDVHSRFVDMSRRLESGDSAGAEALFAELEAEIPHPERADRTVDHSIDFAVMMPITARECGLEPLVLPGRFPWSDVGSWDALRELMPADERGVVRTGDVTTLGTRDSILVAEEGRAIETHGVSRLVVVHAADGTVLVTREKEAPHLRVLVRALASHGNRRAIFFESESCVVELVGEGSLERTVLFRVRNLRVERDGDTVRILPLSENDADARAALLDRLAEAPRALVPSVRHYAWGGSVLPEVLGAPAPADGAPTAEAWLTATQRDGAASLAGADLRLDEWIAARPEILGEWSRRLFGDEAPIFVKLLSTRFPPRVHIAFRPGAVDSDRDRFRRFLVERLREERDRLRELLALLGEETRTNAAVFAGWRAAWERWAVDQMRSQWKSAIADRRLVDEAGRFLSDERARERFVSVIESLRENRATLVALFCEVDLREEIGNVLLSPAGLPHAIFGLSHQSHPIDRSSARLRELLVELRREAERGTSEADLARRAEDARAELERLRAENVAPPKNEAWVALEHRGEVIILEPQQTSNTTYGWLDTTTPFEFRDGRVVFRKGDAASGLDDASIERYVAELDIEPRDIASLRRGPVEIDAGPEAREARLFRLIDDPEDWPYFVLYRVDLEGEPGRPARFASDHPRGAFQEIIATRGRVRVSVPDGRAPVCEPGSPIFVPATARGGYVLECNDAATVWLVSVPTPWSEPPVRTAGG